MNFAPILCYHRIVSPEDKASKFELNEDKFMEQMEILSKHGFSSFLVGDDPQGVLPPRDADLRRVMITFDDGYASDYNRALPVLKKFGFRAVFFVTAGLIGKQGYMTSKEIRELALSGASIQSHSFNHHMLAELSREEISYELKKSKEVLEEITRTEVGYISLPGGSISDAVLEKVAETGYKGVYTSMPGYRLRRLHDLAIFERFMVHSDTPSEAVLKIARKDPVFHGKTVFMHLAKKLGKRIFKKKRSREKGQ